MPLRLKKHLRKEKKWLKEEAEELTMLREDGPCPVLEGSEQDEGLDPETKKQKIHQPTLVNTLYARVLGATAVSHGMYSFETELECFLSEPVIERSDMPLQWWQKNETRFKTLAHLANQIHCA